MKTNIQFRLGFLDGIQDRQQDKRRNLDKIERVKNSNYFLGYLRGLSSSKSINNNIEKGNVK